jgi:hypothetical protein
LNWDLFLLFFAAQLPQHDDLEKHHYVKYWGMGLAALVNFAHIIIKINGGVTQTDKGDLT